MNVNIWCTLFREQDWSETFRTLGIAEWCSDALPSLKMILVLVLNTDRVCRVRNSRPFPPSFRNCVKINRNFFKAIRNCQANNSLRSRWRRCEKWSNLREHIYAYTLIIGGLLYSLQADVFFRSIVGLRQVHTLFRIFFTLIRASLTQYRNNVGNGIGIGDWRCRP